MGEEGGRVGILSTDRNVEKMFGRLIQSEVNWGKRGRAIGKCEKFKIV